MEPLVGAEGREFGAFGQLAPAADAVVGNVAEQQVVAAPDGPLGESEAAGDAFQVGARLDQLGEASGHVLKLDVEMRNRFGHGAGSKCQVSLAPILPDSRLGGQRSGSGEGCGKSSAGAR